MKDNYRTYICWHVFKILYLKEKSMEKAGGGPPAISVHAKHDVRFITLRFELVPITTFLSPGFAGVGRP